MRKLFVPLLPVILLLLVHTFIRTHDIDAQLPYIDEGIHAERGTIVWDFNQNPGRLSAGKLLLYYWLGLFESSGLAYLHTARLAIALLSIVTGAVVFRLATIFGGYVVGILALGLYAFFPYAVFFERMALAEGMVAMLVGLVAWRSWLFARRPTLREGGVLGVLLGLATLTKLTAGLVPLLPALAALVYWRPSEMNPVRFVRLYAPPLVLAAAIVLLMWAPLAIPAELSQDSNDPFTLVDDDNRRTWSDLSVFEYLRRLSGEIVDFVALPAIIGVWCLVGVMFGPGWQAGREDSLPRDLLFLIAWLVLTGALTVLTALLVTSRYFMPLSVPFVILMAVIWGRMWYAGAYPLLWRGAALVALGVWFLGFAMPHTFMTITEPRELPFDNTNHTEYQNGVLIGESAARTAAETVNAADPAITAIYGTWEICYQMYFYLTREVECLERVVTYGSWANRLRSDLREPDDQIYLVNSAYSDEFFSSVPGHQGRLVGQYVRDMPFHRDIRIWAISQYDGSADIPIPGR